MDLSQDLDNWCDAESDESFEAPRAQRPAAAFRMIRAGFILRQAPHSARLMHRRGSLEASSSALKILKVILLGSRLQ